MSEPRSPADGPPAEVLSPNALQCGWHHPVEWQRPCRDAAIGVHQDTMVIALDREVPASASPAAADPRRSPSCVRRTACSPPRWRWSSPAPRLVIAAADGPSPVEIVRPVLVVLWAAAGLLLGLRRRHDRLAPIVLGGALVGAIGTLAAAMIAHRSLDGSAGVRLGVTVRFAAALLPAVALHLLLGLADGRLATPIRRNTVLAGYVAGAAIGVGAARRAGARRHLAARRALARRPGHRPVRRPRPLRQGRRR